MRPRPWRRVRGRPPLRDRRADDHLGRGHLGGISLAGTIVGTVAKGGGDGLLAGLDETTWNEAGTVQTIGRVAP